MSLYLSPKSLIYFSQRPESSDPTHSQNMVPKDEGRLPVMQPSHPGIVCQVDRPQIIPNYFRWKDCLYILEYPILCCCLINES